MPVSYTHLQQFNTEGNKITGSGESYYYNGEAWSAISDPKNYKKLQKEIRDIAKEQGISPIQWEGPVWIKVAQNLSLIHISLHWL